MCIRDRLDRDAVEIVVGGDDLFGGLDDRVRLLAVLAAVRAVQREIHLDDELLRDVTLGFRSAPHQNGRYAFQCLDPFQVQIHQSTRIVQGRYAAAIPVLLSLIHISEPTRPY
eukprot:TRINITY_DN3595_c0_g1_i2.p1 TRINITY_DN3595_c0_g1~~TRINITY_DN3595_c0_g1_i2.p1  ORF type:complete len:113 (-),score=35.72 TRINITY_DN3595_c0_g1_i2:97-435(-)